ncbi:MAG TPA: hypothetical protein VF756_04250 [Thermoanaerobaculia bacterium]
MKEQNPHSRRILGRKLAREMTREQVAKATGGVHAGPPTYTMSYPPDRDRPEADF